MLNKKLKVVCFGGGSGLSHFIKGIKDLDNIDLKCIVTVADNGGSTGILKKELDIPAVGDIRNVLYALSNAPEALGNMLLYRFDKGSLAGHSLGNIMIAGLFESTNRDFVETVESLSQIFNIFGKVIPSTDQVVDIKATLEDDTIVYGEKKIGKTPNIRIKNIEYINKVKATPSAIQAIKEADLIIYSIGSLYTSLIPNLIIPEIKEAIKNSSARKIYFANLMTQPGETDNYTLSDHIAPINAHLGFKGVDVVVINNRPFTPAALERYAQKDAYPVLFDSDHISPDLRILQYDIAKIDETNRIMHSPKKIRKLIGEDLECLFQGM